MKSVDLLKFFLWALRRNEKDTVNIYDSLSGIMQMATGGDMLNFGYWDNGSLASTPLDAQQRLCSVFGSMAQLRANQKVVDVGSGYGAPAMQWQRQYGPLDIISLNISYEQLRCSNVDHSTRINATATALPFEDSSVDRVLAFESAQHFRPLSLFLSESYRILDDSGILALAIPVMSKNNNNSIIKLGLLYVTWSSEHYSECHLLDSIKDAGFEIICSKKIGSQVYDPLASYYKKNRNDIKNKMSGAYPSLVEKILYMSIKKMQSVSEKKIIDYLLIVCKKQRLTKNV